MSITDPEYEANPALTWFNDVWPTNELSVADREALSRRGYLSYELDEKLTVLSLNTLPYSVRKPLRCRGGDSLLTLLVCSPRRRLRLTSSATRSANSSG